LQFASIITIAAVVSTFFPNDRILVVGPSWVGDMVMAQSLFKTLKQKSPQANIDILAPSWSAPLLQRMPEIKEVVIAPFQHRRADLRKRVQLGRRLRSANYQWAILLPNSWKSALVPFWARIPRRTGYVGEQRWGLINDIRRLERNHLPMTVQRFVALAGSADQPPPSRESMPVPELKVDQSQVGAALTAMQLPTPDRPILMLCPGAAFGPAKQWPAEHFAHVARQYLSQGWEVWLMGSQHDAQAAAQIASLCAAECINLAGRTSLAQAIDLMSLASLVISNDSGLMHVAAALGRPLVAVYGSSDPSVTPPLTPNSTVVTLNLSCSPCFKRRCPLGHLKCLRDLTPERVAIVAKQLTTDEFPAPNTQPLGP
jgi:heptosyltransferase-2